MHTNSNVNIVLFILHMKIHHNTIKYSNYRNGRETMKNCINEKIALTIKVHKKCWYLYIYKSTNLAWTM